MKVRERLPPNSTLEAAGRLVRIRKLLALAVVLERTHLGQSLSQEQVEEPSDIVGKVAADDVDDDSDSSSGTCIQKENKRSQRKLKARRARRRTRVHSELLKPASADTMMEKPALTTRTRMRYSQSREKLFSLLDLAEHTMMDMADATLDRKMCELFTQLRFGGEQCGCGEQIPSRPRKPGGVSHPAGDAKLLMLGCWAAICW